MRVAAALPHPTTTVHPLIGSHCRERVLPPPPPGAGSDDRGIHVGTENQKCDFCFSAPLQLTLGRVGGCGH